MKGSETKEIALEQMKLQSNTFNHIGGKSR